MLEGEKLNVVRRGGLELVELSETAKGKGVA